MKYKNRKGKNKKPKIWVSKKNAHIKKNRNENSYYLGAVSPFEKGGLRGIYIN